MHVIPRPIIIFLVPKREVCVATSSEIRVYAMLLFFILGN